MEVVLFSFRIFLAAVFGIAAFGKFADGEGSRKAVADFGAPGPLVPALAVLLPVLELAIAVALIPVSTSWFGAVGAFILLVIFISAMTWQMAKGNAPDCHCFGAIHSEPVSGWTVARNGAFAAPAGLLVVSGMNRQGLSLTSMSPDLLLLFLISIAAIGALLVAVFALMKRVKLLEGAAGILAETERDGVGHPDDALPIGAPAPDFELRDAAGGLVTFETLLTRGKPLLMFFVGPACEPCKGLLPEIAAWKAEFGGRVEVVLVSSGTAEENLAKFRSVPPSDILLQNEREVASVFRAQWTPAAVFVSEGMIGSRVAVGDAQIRDLVDGLRAKDFEAGFTFVARGTHARVRIGESVGEFSAEDVDGRRVTQEYFSGRRTLVVFWTDSCSHCTSMMGEVKDWERARAMSDPALLVVSEGDPDRYRALGLQAPVIVEPSERVLSVQLGMRGAPSAVVVDERGLIATETAIGTTAVWALVGRF